MITLSHTQRTARKEHVCNYCCQTIPKGEKYHISTHVFEGSMYTWKSHRSCEALAHHLNMFDYHDEGLTQEDFWECVKDRYHDVVRNESLPPKQEFSEILDFVLKNEGLIKP